MTPDQVKAAGAEMPALIHWPHSYFERLDVEKLFAARQPVEVELGSGDGSFLAAWAHGHPQTNFIGVERLMGRLRKLDRKGRRAALRNLSLVRIEAGYFLEWMLPAYSVAAMHIYFPDPWPKRKHRRHRLVNERFPELAARVLQPAGHVYLRTDDLDYFQQMQAVFAAAPRFLPVDAPAELLALKTDFEQEFNARGVPTRAAAYQLIETV